MSSSAGQWSASFAGAGADAMRVYDTVVARLFGPFAADLVDRVAPEAGQTALDVACGPGTVTHLLAARVGPNGKVIATDISPSMLEIARAKDTPGAAIEWVEAPAAPLPLPDASADVATCQQGLQFFPDKTGALQELRRVLRSGGRAGVAVWTALEDQDFLAALQASVAAVVSDEMAEGYLGPFSMTGDAAAAHARDAGFGTITLERVTLPVTMDADPGVLVSTLAATALAKDIAALDEARVQALVAEVGRRTTAYRRGELLHGTMTASVLTLS